MEKCSTKEKFRQQTDISIAVYTIDKFTLNSADT